MRNAIKILFLLIGISMFSQVAGDKRIIEKTGNPQQYDGTRWINDWQSLNDDDFTNITTDAIVAGGKFRFNGLGQVHLPILTIPDGEYEGQELQIFNETPTDVSTPTNITGKFFVPSLGVNGTIVTAGSMSASRLVSLIWDEARGAWVFPAFRHSVTKLDSGNLNFNLSAGAEYYVMATGADTGYTLPETLAEKVELNLSSKNTASIYIQLYNATQQVIDYLGNEVPVGQALLLQGNGKHEFIPDLLNNTWEQSYSPVGAVFDNVEFVKPSEALTEGDLRLWKATLTSGTLTQGETYFIEAKANRTVSPEDPVDESEVTTGNYIITKAPSNKVSTIKYVEDGNNFGYLGSFAYENDQPAYYDGRKLAAGESALLTISAGFTFIDSEGIESVGVSPLTINPKEFYTVSRVGNAITVAERANISTPVKQRKEYTYFAHTIPDPTNGIHEIAGGTIDDQDLADFITANTITGFSVVGSVVTIPDWRGRYLGASGARGISTTSGTILSSVNKSHRHLVNTSSFGGGNAFGSATIGFSNNGQSQTGSTYTTFEGSTYARPETVGLPLCVIIGTAQEYVLAADVSPLQTAIDNAVAAIIAATPTPALQPDIPVTTSNVTLVGVDYFALGQFNGKTPKAAWLEWTNKTANTELCQSPSNFGDWLIVNPVFSSSNPADGGQSFFTGNYTTSFHALQPLNNGIIRRVGSSGSDSGRALVVWIEL